MLFGVGRLDQDRCSRQAGHRLLGEMPGRGRRRVSASSREPAGIVSYVGIPPVQIWMRGRIWVRDGWTGASWQRMRVAMPSLAGVRSAGRRRKSDSITLSATAVALVARRRRERDSLTPADSAELVAAGILRPNGLPPSAPVYWIARMR